MVDEKFLAETRSKRNQIQNDVWQALPGIPFAKQEAWTKLSATTRQPASDASGLGAADGRNPISIVVPCTA